MDINIAQLIASVLSGLAICIPAIVALVKAVKTAVQTKNWNQIVNMAFTYIEKAESLYTNGADKKEWVMGMIEAAAKSVNFNYDDTAKAQISDMIDAAVTMSKSVNTVNA